LIITNKNDEVVEEIRGIDSRRVTTITTASSDMVESLSINGLPTCTYIKNGRVIGRVAGSGAANQLID